MTPYLVAEDSNTGVVKRWKIIAARPPEYCETFLDMANNRVDTCVIHTARPEDVRIILDDDGADET